jgi:small subunit ribosomal protein S4e
MVKSHLKTITVPKTWGHVLRKATIYVTRPKPGPHTMDMSMSIASMLKNIGVAQTTKEVRFMLQKKQVLVDSRRIKSHKFPVGFMDVLSLPLAKKNYTITIDNKGKLQPVETSTDKSKTVQVRSRRMITGGKLQLNLADGRNIVTDKKDIKPGDSLTIEVPSQKISKHFPLKQGAEICLTGGKHVGDRGQVNEITGKDLTYKSGDKTIKTLTKYAYVISK